MHCRAECDLHFGRHIISDLKLTSLSSFPTSLLSFSCNGDLGLLFGVSSSVVLNISSIGAALSWSFPHQMAPPSVTSLAIAVLAASFLFIAVVDGAMYMSVKNKLPGPVRIHCWSDKETLPYHDSAPGASYGFDFHREKQLSWSCSFSGPDSYSGSFLMWQSRGSPCYSVYACPWVADDYGLSLVRYDGYVEHVYRWP